MPVCSLLSQRKRKICLLERSRTSAKISRVAAGRRSAGCDKVGVMSSTKWMLLILLGLFLVPPSPAQTSRPVTQRKAKAKHRVAKPSPAPPAPRQMGALPQVPLDQIPAVPPQVSYQSGMLTIVAQNSTLSDILREVRNRTGAAIDIPPNANDRVVTHLGPGPVRDVLASLLNGTSFNYVMVGSSTDPKGLSSLVLTHRPAGGAPQTVAMQQPTPEYNPPVRMGPGPPGFVPPPQMAQVQPAEDDNSDDSQDADDNSDPDQQDAQQDTNSGAPQGVPQPNAGPKTPEQILEMLRKRGMQPPGQPGQPLPPGQQPGNNPPDEQ